MEGEPEPLPELPEIAHELEELANFVIDAIQTYEEHGLEQTVDPDCIIERFPDWFVW